MSRLTVPPPGLRGEIKVPELACSGRATQLNFDRADCAGGLGRAGTVRPRRPRGGMEEGLCSLRRLGGCRRIPSRVALAGRSRATPQRRRSEAERTLDRPAILRGTVYGDTLPDGAESTSLAEARRGPGGLPPGGAWLDT